MDEEQRPINDGVQVMSRTIWETRDGRKVKIVDMDDTHLLNTIKAVLRAQENAETFHTNMAIMFDDEDNHFENQLEYVRDMDEFCPQFQAMVKEAKRRRLPVPAETS